MYQHHFNLQELPFELTANPKYLLLTPRHQEALSNLEYGLLAAKSVTVLIGEAGTGKTTLIAAALSSPRCAHVQTIVLNNPALTRAEFISVLGLRFGLAGDALSSKGVLLEMLERTLRERADAGHGAALVVDEAQRLSPDLLEEIRLLANIETADRKLLPLVLAGQPELADRLEERSFRQLKQRVALRCNISPFDLHETATYIASRVRVAGGTPARLFTREAIELIHRYSGGIARTINVICDNALVSAFALDRQTVDSAIVQEVGRDFVLGGKLFSRAAERREVDLPLQTPRTWTNDNDDLVLHPQTEAAPAASRSARIDHGPHLADADSAPGSDSGHSLTGEGGLRTRRAANR